MATRVNGANRAGNQLSKQRPSAQGGRTIHAVPSSGASQRRTKKWRPQSVHRKGRSSQRRAFSREFRSPTSLKSTDRQCGHRANSTLQHLRQHSALGYLGMVVHARRGDPHDNQGDIILGLAIVEKPVNSPEHFISNFRCRSPKKAEVAQKLQPIGQPTDGMIVAAVLPALGAL